ncbi:hypothetical protein [Pseudonocardia sp.]|uniref:hypothetical protein n=1 Tax=Pseudonocardia sp. TaxID=60912 RepID=UPI003BEEBCFA
MELAGPPQPDVEVPAVVSRLAGGAPVRPVWRNELGGLTFELGGGPSGPGSPRRFVKWAPSGTADLPAQAARLRWAGAFTPVPPVLAPSEDGDGDGLLTEALAGENAVSPRWLARPADAAEAIGAGLRAFHSALPVPDCPFRSDPGPGAPPTPTSGRGGVPRRRLRAEHADRHGRSLVRARRPRRARRRRPVVRPGHRHLEPGLELRAGLAGRPARRLPHRARPGADGALPDLVGQRADLVLSWVEFERRSATTGWAVV